MEGLPREDQSISALRQQSWETGLPAVLIATPSHTFVYPDL